MNILKFTLLVVVELCLYWKPLNYTAWSTFYGIGFISQKYSKTPLHILEMCSCSINVIFSNLEISYCYKAYSFSVITLLNLGSIAELTH